VERAATASPLRRSMARLALALGIVLCLSAIATVPALAADGADEGECPNTQIRALQVYSSHLPDCRAYEQVTPVDKDASSPTGSNNQVQASPDGDRLTFIDPAGIPGGVGSATFPVFLASRAGASWSTQGLTPPSQPGFSGVEVTGWNENLTTVASTTVLAGEEQGNGLYLEDTATGSYQLVAGPLPGNFYLEPTPAGFSADGSHMIFESSEPFLPEAAAGENNLYEWYDGKLAVAGVLPASEGGGAPPEGSFAGPYNWVKEKTTQGGAEKAFYTQNTISADGSRVIFTAGGSGQLYLRENGTSTVRLSTEQRTTPDPNGPRPAAFMAANPEDSEVYFTSCEKLTEDSTAASTVESSACTETSQGQDLYAYDVISGTLSDLTVDHNAADPLGAAVQGVLGQGESAAGGTYVYFVANGVLAAGASPGDCHGVHAEEGTTCNLYVWHGGAGAPPGGSVSFVTELEAGEASLGSLGWYPEYLSQTHFEKTSRVTPDGKVLLFTSQRPLTAYDSAGHAQLYRYDAGNGQLSCVSCNPTAPASVSSPSLRSISTTSNQPSPTPFLTRNLSADGAQVFFESEEALLPQDTNGVQDVYEWEAEGVGTCQGSSEGVDGASGGCLYLISTGRSAQPSYFADAGAGGEDVFFFTSQSLVAQDQDQLVDVYDARADGGIVEQNATPPAPCEGEACRGAGSTTPVVGTPSSATITGTGNLAPPAATRAQLLAKALKACKKKPKKQRGSCEARAEKKYGKQGKPGRSTRVRKSHKGAK
jgi:hypothetical protein